MRSKTTRRTFLRNSILGGTGLLVLRDSTTAFGFQANDKLHVASVGVAGMGWGDLSNTSSENIVALAMAIATAIVVAYSEMDSSMHRGRMPSYLGDLGYAPPTEPSRNYQARSPKSEDDLFD